jgi:serine/threonine-protein kinase
LVLREGEKGREETVVLKVVGKPHADSGASESPAEPPATTAPHDASTGDGQRTVGLVVGAAGLVGLGIGSVLGLVSKGTYDHAMSAECGGNPADCTPQGARDGSTAHSQATMATVAFLAGGAALGAGAVLYLTAPKSGVSVGATMAPGTAQLRVVASW